MSSILRHNQMKIQELSRFVRGFDPSKVQSAEDWSRNESAAFEPGMLIFCLERASAPQGLAFGKREETQETYKVRDLCVVVGRDNGRPLVVNITASAYELRFLEVLLLEKARKAILDSKDFIYVAAQPSQLLTENKVREIEQLGAVYAQGGSRRTLAVDGSTVQEPATALLAALGVKLQLGGMTKQPLDIGSVCHMLFTPDGRTEDRNKALVKQSFTPVPSGMSADAQTAASDYQKSQAAEAASQELSGSPGRQPPVSKAVPPAEKKPTGAPTEGLDLKFSFERTEISTDPSSWQPQSQGYTFPAQFSAADSQPGTQAAPPAGGASDTATPAATTASAPRPESAPPQPPSSPLPPSDDWQNINIEAAKAATQSLADGQPVLSSTPPAETKSALPQPPGDNALQNKLNHEWKGFVPPKLRPLDAVPKPQPPAEPSEPAGSGAVSYPEQTVAVPMPPEPTRSQPEQQPVVPAGGLTASQESGPEGNGGTGAQPGQTKAGHSLFERLNEQFAKTFQSQSPPQPQEPAQQVPPSSPSPSAPANAWGQSKTPATNWGQAPGAPSPAWAPQSSGFYHFETPASPETPPALSQPPESPPSGSPLSFYEQIAGTAPAQQPDSVAQSSVDPEAVPSESPTQSGQGFNSLSLGSSGWKPVSSTPSTASGANAASVAEPTASGAGINRIPDATASGVNMNRAPDVAASGVNMNRVPDVAASGVNMNRVPESTASGVNMNRVPDATASGANMNRVPDATASGANMNRVPDATASGVNMSRVPDATASGDTNSGASGTTNPALTSYPKESASGSDIKPVPSKGATSSTASGSKWKNPFSIDKVAGDRASATASGAGTDPPIESYAATTASGTNFGSVTAAPPFEITGSITASSTNLKPMQAGGSRPTARTGLGDDLAIPGVDEPPAQLAGEPAAISSGSSYTSQQVEAKNDLAVALAGVMSNEGRMMPPLRESEPAPAEPPAPPQSAAVPPPFEPAAEAEVQRSVAPEQLRLPQPPAPPPMSEAAALSGTTFQESKLVMNEMATLMTRLEQQVAKAGKKLNARAEEIKQRLQANVAQLVSQAAEVEKASQALISNSQHQSSKNLDDRAEEVRNQISEVAGSGRYTIKQLLQSNQAQVEDRKSALYEGLRDVCQSFRTDTEKLTRVSQDRLNQLVNDRTAQLEQLAASITERLDETNEGYADKLTVRFDRFRERMGEEASSVVRSLERNVRSMTEEIDGVWDRASDKLRSSTSEFELTINHAVRTSQLNISSLTRRMLSEMLIPRLRERKAALRNISNELSRRFAIDSDRQANGQLLGLESSLGAARQQLQSLVEECISSIDTVGRAQQASLEEIFKDTSAVAEAATSEVTSAVQRAEITLRETEHNCKNLAESSSLEGDADLNEARIMAGNRVQQLRLQSTTDLTSTIESGCSHLEQISQRVQSELSASRMENTQAVRDAAEQGLTRLRDAIQESLSAIQAARDKYME